MRGMLSSEVVKMPGHHALKTPSAGKSVTDLEYRLNPSIHVLLFSDL